jgi:hypothetical protein
MQSVLLKMPRQPPVRRVRELARRQAFQLATQQQALLGQSIAAESMASPSPAQRKGAVDKCPHGARQSRRAPGGKRGNRTLATCVDPYRRL